LTTHFVSRAVRVRCRTELGNDELLSEGKRKNEREQRARLNLLGISLARDHSAYNSRGIFLLFQGAIIISDARCRRGYINSQLRLRMSLAEATGLAQVADFNQ